MKNLELIMFHPFGKKVNNKNLDYISLKTDLLSNKNVLNEVLLWKKNI
jgi:hypothetical protein